MCITILLVRRGEILLDFTVLDGYDRERGRSLIQIPIHLLILSYSFRNFLILIWT